MVTFEDVHGKWVEYKDSAKPGNPTRAILRDFWIWLTEETQPSRWFYACQHAVHHTDGTMLRALESTAKPAIEDLDLTTLEEARLLERGLRKLVAPGMIEAHLKCAQLAHKRQRIAPSLLLFQDLADKLQMPCGFFYDLTLQLLQCPRKSVHTYAVTVPVLLLDPETEKGTKTEKGIVATLRFDLLANGEGQLWPAPALAFVHRDAAFRGAEVAAKTYLEQEQVWRNSHDVRWSIQRDDDVPLSGLTGNSLGGAFAVALTTLWAWATYVDAGRLRALAPLLSLAQGLRLPGTAVTAALDEEGNLCPVGGINQKLRAVSEHPFIQRVIVAAQQKLPSNFEQDRRNLARYIGVSARHTSHLEVWRVSTVREALTALYNTRRQTFLETIYKCTTQLPMLCGAPLSQVQAKLRADPGDADLVWDIAEASSCGDICIPGQTGIAFLALTEQGRQRISLLTRFNAQLWTLLGRDAGLFVVSFLLALGGYTLIHRKFYTELVVPYPAAILLGGVCVSLLALVPSSVFVRWLRQSRFLSRHYLASLEACTWRIGKPLCYMIVVESIPFFVLYFVCAMINGFVVHWRISTLCLMAIFSGGLSGVVRFFSWANGQSYLALQSGILLLLCALSVRIGFLSMESFANFPYIHTGFVQYGHKVLVQCFVFMILVIHLAWCASAMGAGFRRGRKL